MSQVLDIKAKNAQEKRVSKKQSILQWVRELKAELKKVSWTSKEELVLFTKIVLGSTFFLGLGIYLVDLSIKGVLELIKVVLHFIFG